MNLGPKIGLGRALGRLLEGSLRSCGHLEPAQRQESCKSMCMDSMGMQEFMELAASLHREVLTSFERLHAYEGILLASGTDI